MSQMWKRGHKAFQCKFIKEKCNACGKIGHLKRMCKSRTQGAVKTVEDTSTTVSEQYQLYQLEDATMPKATDNPYVVTLTVEGKELQFEIDTGASLSLISEETYKEFWPAHHYMILLLSLKCIQAHHYKYWASCMQQ